MGLPARHEPLNTQELRQNSEVFAIFQAAGWIEFFERLDGFNREAALQFALHLQDTHSEVWGLRIEFSEAIISEVTALPRVGKPWFERRVPTMVAREEFLREGEHVQSSKRGIALQSLPRPWDQVAVFLKKYITCEGRYQIVYNTELPLLSHLRHGILLNIPYYLFHSLRRMAVFVQTAKHPHVSLTHHGLIKLIIVRTLAQHNITWDQFLAQNQEPAPVRGFPAEQAQLQHHMEDRRPSNIVGGGDDIVLEQAEPLRGNVESQLDSRIALQSEGEIGAALDAATIEPENDRAKAIGEQMEQMEPVTVESSPEWGGGTLIEEEGSEAQVNIPLTPAGNPDKSAPQAETSRKGRKRPMKEPSITAPTGGKRSKPNTISEEARKRWRTLESQVEIPILVPRPMDAPARSVEAEPSIEGLLEENTVLKEEVQLLRREVETWKETCRKQGERKMYTLVEAADHLEGTESIDPDREEEQVMCPNCGEIFRKEGHGIIIRTMQQPTSTREEPAEEEDAVTQEPASLIILAEAATNTRAENEIRSDDGQEDCNMDPECSQDIEMMETEPRRQNIDEPEQGTVVSEVQMGRGKESGMDDTLEPKEEFDIVNPECPHDAKLREELHPQEDEEAIQDVVTQEPTSLGIPEFQTEGIDIIPDIQYSEDEQTIASGDTEILEEELYDGEDIQSQERGNESVAATQEPATQQLNSGMQVEDTATQEPVSQKAMEIEAEENLKSVAATQEPATQPLNPEMQVEDTATQEPVSQKAMEADAEESLKSIAATQEPATHEADVEMQADQGEDTVTQEPVSQHAPIAAMEENPGDIAVTQEPATLIEEVQVDTVSQETILLPSRNFIDLDTEREEHYKKEISDLTAEVSALRMEVIKWRSQVEENQKKTIALDEHKRIIRALEEQGAEERMGHRVQVGELQQEIKKLKKFSSMQKDKDQMYDLSRELIGTRKPSSSYPVFLFEQFVWFKLKAVQEGRLFEIATSEKFLETFLGSNFEEQNLLCELYLHEMACPMDRHSNPVPFAGDVQLRAFASFVNNHVQWERSFQTFSHNEGYANLWIRSEPQNPGILLARYKNFLSIPSQEQHIMKLQEEVISTCTKSISRQQQVALDGSRHRWQASSSALRSRDPYCFKNF